MNRERDNKSRAEEIRRRREEEQKRRSVVTTQRKRPEHKPAAPAAAIGTPRTARSRFSSRYDIAMSSPNYSSRAGSMNRAGGWQIQAPSIPRPSFGPRWISFLVLLACAAGLYALLAADIFLVRQVQVQGNGRISSQEITGLIAGIGGPSALLNPLQIEYNVLTAYPDIETVSISVDLPAQVTITVVERQPVIAWQQNNQLVWVDAKGFAFPPRGIVDGLVNVSAEGVPPAPTLDVTQTIGARPFLTKELAQSISTLAPYVPQGATLIYDPTYGLGWSDPRGWQAFFGQTNGQVTLKLQVYQSMVETLNKRGIRPSLISVEYPDAPFYREK